MVSPAKIAKRVQRIFDDRPIAAHIYVTERCNLRCSYCTEYDNQVPNPDLDTVRRWVDRLHELGTLRIGIQGGEPLLHKDIVGIVKHIKDRGMGCSMSSNGHLIRPELVAALEEAGLDSIHISIDRMTPDDHTRKCVSLVESRFGHLQGSKIGLHITGVLYGGSLAELPGVFRFAEQNRVSMKAHLVHAGIEGGFTIDPGEKAELEAFIDWEIREKQRGRNMRVMFNVLRYQKGILNGDQDDWTCMAGYKYLFISARGEFWICSMRREPGTPFLEVTPEMLRSYNRKKRCQKACGVYCVVTESLFHYHPLRFVGREVAGYLRGLPMRLGGSGSGA